CSYAVLEHAQPPDHRLDAVARLLVLLQKGRTFTGEVVLAVPQRAIFLGELLHQRKQLVDAHFQALQVGFDGAVAAVVAHLQAIRPAPHAARQVPRATPSRPRHNAASAWPFPSTPLMTCSARWCNPVHSPTRPKPMARWSVRCALPAAR